MVAGTIIGASIFVQPSEIARHLDTPGQIMLVWIVCGVLTLFGALVCAELASAFPQTGGVYVFLRDTFSPLAGFLWGWAMFWSMHSGIVAAIAVVFARYFAFFVPIGDTGVRVVAVVVILALSALNYAGVRAGGRVQTALTGAKLAAIAIVVVVGVIASNGASMGLQTWRPPAHRWPRHEETPRSTIFCWRSSPDSSRTAAGTWSPTRPERRGCPRERSRSRCSLASGSSPSAYVALNLVYLRILPLDALRSSTRVAADAADAVLGRGGSAVLAALVMVSSIGGLTGIVLTGPRVYFSMAHDGLAPRWLGYVHPVHQTPSHAIVAQAVWASVLAATGAYRELFTRVIYTEWLFFALMAAGLFVLRRRPDYRPSYRTWGYPAVPLIFIVASLAIVINQFVSTPGEAAVGLGLVAIGAPIYYLRHAYR